MIRLAHPSLILALALGACVAPAAGGLSLAGETWRFVSIDGAAPMRTPARLAFHADRIGANVGCNGMGGPWRIAEGRLIAGPLVSTQMWCEGIMEQERAVNALLSSAPEIRVDGSRMTLQAGGHQAHLVRE